MARRGTSESPRDVRVVLRVPLLRRWVSANKAVENEPTGNQGNEDDDDQHGADHQWRRVRGIPLQGPCPGQERAQISIQGSLASRVYYRRKRAEGNRHTQAVLALARRGVNVGFPPPGWLASGNGA